jgi:hypothetical protein
LADQLWQFFGLFSFLFSSFKPVNGL